MEFIQHTLNWVKGEILEAVIMGICALIIMLCSFLFWKFGNTPNAKALVLPLLFVGFFPFVMAISGVISNKKRISTYSQAWQDNPKEFIQVEYKRVKGFDKIFKYSYPAAFIFTVAGAILFFLIDTPTWKAISLSFIILGFMAYMIDFFAAERANIYLKFIEEAM